jgi:hypothetical protein
MVPSINTEQHETGRKMGRNELIGGSLRQNSSSDHDKKAIAT